MPDPNLQSVAFPTLDDARIAELGLCTAASPKAFRAGETLFRIGDREFAFFIVKSGEIEIVDHSSGEPKTLVVHGKGSFTGEVYQLTGAPAPVSAIARTNCEVFEVSPDLDRSAHWPLRRQPFLLETSRPGVFAAGDVRSGSVKRVASAVGEGSMAVQFVHQYLSQV